MLEFHTPTLDDKHWAQPILTAAGGLGSEDAFGTLFIWSGSYHSRICRWRDMVLTCFGKNTLTYGFPVGARSPEELREVLELLRHDAEERGIPLRLWGMTAEEKEQIESVLPGFFQYSSTPNDSDYLYASSDLAQLAGRKYHSKRNHIARFRKQYSYTYETVTPDNLSDCEFVAREWCHAHGCGGELKDENCAIVKTLRNYEALGFRGGLIRVEGKPVAFTAGEEINPTAFDIHFEKALDGYDGLYTLINQEFAAHELTGYQWINREEDMGIEGLRKAKNSYYPACVLEKFNAVRED